MNNWVPKNKIVKFAAVTALFSVILYFGGLFIVSEKIKKIEDDYHSTESDSYKEEKFDAISPSGTFYLIYKFCFVTLLNKKILECLYRFCICYSYGFYDSEFFFFI